jgi:ribosomal protein S18 acetylase RimI-like enzyme
VLVAHLRSLSPVESADTLANIAGIFIRPAAPEDVNGVLELLSEAASWTAALGYPNWPAQFPRTMVTHGIAEGELFVAEADGSLVATVNLQWSDVMFWGEREPDAGYVHRLVVRRDHAGAGLGAALVDWAAQQVSAAGRACLRLDVSADNLPLCSYYERLGFVHRGDREGELTEPDGRVRHWRSRLYERRCEESQS